MTKFTCLLAIALLLVVGCCSAFSPTLHTRSTPLAASTTTSLHMAVAKKRKPPTYDYKTERWTPASEEDSAANGYDGTSRLLEGVCNLECFVTPLVSLLRFIWFSLSFCILCFTFHPLYYQKIIMIIITTNSSTRQSPPSRPQSLLFSCFQSRYVRTGLL